MKPIRLLLFMSCYFTILQVNAQEQKTVRDAGLWAGVSLDYQFNKQWKTRLTQEIRSFSNATKLHEAITDLEAFYKINKNYRLGFGLRYAYARNNKLTLNRNVRYNIDLKCKNRLTKKFDLSYRFRFQHNYEHPFTGLRDYRQKMKARNRFKLEYNQKRHSLFLSSEIFREYVFYKRPAFDRLRFTLGDELETKMGDFKYGVGYERQLESENPFNFFFFKLNHTFTLRHG